MKKPLPAPYGGVARQDRIPGKDGPCCDKAWHLDAGTPAPAKIVLRCASCSYVVARCEACLKMSQAHVSMRAHVQRAHRVQRFERNIYGEPVR